MSGGDLQYAVAGAVVDGQFHFDARDGHISHDAGAGHVERFVVFALLCVGHVPPIAVRGEPFVVFACRFQHGFAFGAGHVFGLFHVACYGVRLVHAVPPVAECRIRDEAQRTDHGDCGNGNHHIEQRIRFLMLGSRFNLRTRFNLRIQFDLRSWLGVRFIRHVTYATPASAKPSWQRSAAPNPRPRWPRQSKRPAARRRRCAAGPAWWVACACW